MRPWCRLVLSGFAVWLCQPANFSHAVDLEAIVGNATEPAVSPDGSNLVFVQPLRGPPLEFWPTVQAQTLPGASIRLSSAPSDGWMQSPSWSPDGTRVAADFSGEGSNSNGIWLLSTSYLQPAVHLITDSDARQPTWSNDSSMLAYVSGGNLWIAVFSLPFYLARREIDIPGTASSPSWGPDNEIVFELDGGLWIIDWFTEELRQLTLSGMTDTEPSWSRDGKRIAFSSQRSGNRDIWQIAASGGTTVPLTSDPAVDSHPSWSNSSTSLFFHSDRSGTPQIWLMSNIEDPTVGVESKDWGSIKKLYR